MRRSKGETVKIAFIDPLSGPFAQRRPEPAARASQFVAEAFSASNPAGVKFEVVGFDNKGSPQESLQRAQGRDRPGRPLHHAGQRLVGAALAHHRRRSTSTTSAIPARRWCYFNYAAVDPDLTNSKCVSFWHFRFDADTSMKMEALTTYMKDQTDVKKVYFINQNYAHGQQVVQVRQGRPWRASGPTSQIVGDDLHPLGAGARLRALHRQDQGVGRRHGDHRQLGPDLTLLVKAMPTMPA